MKLFILKTLILGGCLVLLLTILYLVIPVKENNYLMAYKYKCEALEKTLPPRIIFVGGSNLAFGLDSQRIKDSLNLEVINYGLHAGIGLKYMLDDISSYIKTGDIVIFAPEWHQFYTATYGEGVTFATLIKIADRYKYNYLNANQIINIIKGIPNYIAQNTLPQPLTEKAYLASNFNKYGDEVKHWQLENNYKSHQTPIKDKFDKKFGKYFIAKLKKLQTKCQVYVIPPACCKKAFDTWQPQVKEVTHFLEKEKFPFIINPDSCAYNEEYCYDTDYHLNKKGVDLRTSLVIKALKPYIKDTNK